LCESEKVLIATKLHRGAVPVTALNYQSQGVSVPTSDSSSR
jgi:hypothetical protein